jgi:hypothetical protein
MCLSVDDDDDDDTAPSLPSKTRGECSFCNHGTGSYRQRVSWQLFSNCFRFLKLGRSIVRFGPQLDRDPKASP